MILDQQDLINAACLFGAREFNVAPEQIEAVIFYDDEWDMPFGAEISYDGRELELTMPKLIAAIRMFLDEFTDVDPMAASIDIQMDDQQTFFAEIEE